MKVQEQVNALRTVYVKLREELYDHKLRQKLIAVKGQNEKAEHKYNVMLNKIEMTTRMVENCLLKCEAKRALKYLSALRILSNRFKESIEKDFSTLMKKIKLPY